MASESLRGEFRRALQIALAAHFEAAGLVIAFKGRPLEGPQEIDVGCVWFDSKRPHGRDGNNEEAFFGVRVLRRFKQDQGADIPGDETEDTLLWTFETLEDGLKAVINRVDLQSASGVVLTGWEDYFIVTEMSVNHEGQYVQASVAAQARNRTAKGG